MEAIRKGARRPELVPGPVKALLATGEPSVNHMEQIAMDMGALLAHRFPELEPEARRLRDGGLVTRMRTGGSIVLEAFGQESWSTLATERSDTIRGWAAMAVGLAAGIELPERLLLIRPFADDSHFAVREWAWLSLRPHISATPCHAVDLLAPWTHDRSPRIRRFATEVTRPRGVWSQHIAHFKAHPEAALPILRPLRSDPDIYVQDSVSNWLNDASKTSPGWVKSVCDEWLRLSDDQATARICRRASRSVRRLS